MSNPTMAWLAGFMLVDVAAFAADSPVRFGETKVSPQVVRQGGKVAVCIPFECAPGWRYRAYRIIAYRPYVPTACLRAKPWPLSESKHGRAWDSFGIRKWTWLAAAKPQPSALVITLDTTGWPPGDYRLQAVFLFRHDAQPGRQGKRDRYLGRPIDLSVLPPAPSGH